MIISTLWPTESRRGRAGFTLVETMIAVGISGVLFAGVLSMFMLIGRGSLNLVQYTEMEAEARKGLEQFAEDARQASAVTWNSANSLTLTVDSVKYTYAYDDTAKTFARSYIPSGLTATTTRTLISGITSFTLSGYTITGTDVSVANNLATDGGRTSASNVTKQVQISLSAQRTAQGVATATSTVFSARFTLRNKRVTA